MLFVSVSRTAAAAFLMLASAAAAETYYVDFENGSDTNTGTATTRAWKHAPGDPLAKGRPASVVLKPGDVVRFKAGVSYRGSIRLKHSGTARAPITYTGSGWGKGQAIIDGADPVTSAKPCPSQTACGGAPNWKSLQLVTFNQPATELVKIYDDSGLLYESTYPVMADPFWGDDLASYMATPVSQAAQIESGRLENAAMAEKARKAGPNAELSFWITGNLVTRRAIKSVSGNTIYFTPAGLKLYRDRSGKVALVGSPQTLTKQGTYAFLRPGQAVVLPRKGGGKLHVGNGRYGIAMNSQSHITVSGFAFMRGTGSEKSSDEGIAINNLAYKNAKGWTIANNSFGPAALYHGRGIISLSYIDGVTLQDNRIANIEKGSGVRAHRTSNAVLARNDVSRVGRTGIYFGGVTNAKVNWNLVHDIKGIHGNGVSFYLDNKNIRFERNCVIDSVRPLTFKGTGTSFVHNIVIKNNVMIGDSTSDSAVSSWGAKTTKVTITHNVLLAKRFGARLNSQDASITLANNQANGVLITGTKPASWSVHTNRAMAYSNAKNVISASAECNQ